MAVRAKTQLPGNDDKREDEADQEVIEKLQHVPHHCRSDEFVMVGGKLRVLELREKLVERNCPCTAAFEAIYFFSLSVSADRPLLRVFDWIPEDSFPPTRKRPLQYAQQMAI